ncbi:hypothetical protein [Methanotorris formicicus]|uniref:Uncharacterized protein n=1 Tax=Methanotorris formicicus Mc-S-70 TaxID=647171 RepID=H1L1M5_9EURY|nr:hypothetical protein [Methanotorris formicicus]EHP83608.1 hypothetical protein MetfoDRAFT_1949 [Methanotorris formicicus Mc-S-70]
MELKIICKHSKFSKKDEELYIVCEFCNGKDIRTEIELMKEDFEIKKISYPNCKILKRVVK